MDPNIFQLLISQASQNFQSINSARLQAEDEFQKERLDEERQKLLEFANAEAKNLLQESSLHPQKAFVRNQLLLNQLNTLKILPDSYKNQIEKENVALLWSKLIGVQDKCRSQLLPGQLDQCNKCLEAIWMQNFIQAIAQRIVPYNQLQEMKSNLEQERKKQERLEKNWYMGFVGVSTLILIFLFSRHYIENLRDFLTYIIPLVIFPGYLIRMWFRSNYSRINHAYLTYQQGNENESFWSVVKEKFGEIPTEDALQQKWKEQDEIIKVVFGEPDQTN